MNIFSNLAIESDRRIIRVLTGTAKLQDASEFRERAVQAVVEQSPADTKEQGRRGKKEDPDGLSVLFYTRYF